MGLLPWKRRSHGPPCSSQNRVADTFSPRHRPLCRARCARTVATDHNRRMSASPRMPPAEPQSPHCSWVFLPGLLVFGLGLDLLTLQSYRYSGSLGPVSDVGEAVVARGGLLPRTLHVPPRCASSPPAKSSARTGSKAARGRSDTASYASRA